MLYNIIPIMATTILLKEIPDNILKEILKEQSLHREKSGMLLNQSKAVIKMLRDYCRCKDVNNFKADS